MRKTIAALSIALLTAIAPAGAGTRSDAEITDPAEDAYALRHSLENDPTLDIRRAWFETLRSDGVVTGFAVNVEMSKAPDPDELVSVGWALEGTDCFAWTYMYGPSELDRIATDDGSVMIRREADSAILDYGCRSEQPLNLNLVTVRVMGRRVPAGLTIDGNVWRTLIPLSAFDEGDSAGAYVEGAVLDQIWVTSFEFLTAAFVSVDVAPACNARPFGREECEGTSQRPFLLGS